MVFPSGILIDTEALYTNIEVTNELNQKAYKVYSDISAINTLERESELFKFAVTSSISVDSIKTFAEEIQASFEDSYSGKS